jgi:hypothetical protein
MQEIVAAMPLDQVENLSQAALSDANWLVNKLLWGINGCCLDEDFSQRLHNIMIIENCSGRRMQ